MLFNHNRTWRGTEDEVLPIGHWENIRKEGDKILAEPVFDADDFSQKIAAKVKAGTLRMASMGAKRISSSEDPKYIKPGQRYSTVTKWKAREASIVDIGANDNALALYDDNDNLIDLSAGGEIPLKLIQINNDTQMKNLAKVLKLKDGATEQEYLDVVSPMIAENVQLKADLQKVNDEKKIVTDKLEAIEMKEKEARKTEAVALVDAAFTDGRLDADEKGETKEFWLKSFEGNFTGTKTQLERLSKKIDLKDRIDKGVGSGESAWAKRQQEIRDQNK